jgi:hypothetical protein
MWYELRFTPYFPQTKACIASRKGGTLETFNLFLMDLDSEIQEEDSRD